MALESMCALCVPHFERVQIVFEWAAVVERLPRSIMAVFAHVNDDVSHARGVHTAFLSAFANDTSAVQTPLLVYDAKGDSGPFIPPDSRK